MKVKKSLSIMLSLMMLVSLFAGYMPAYAEDSAPVLGSGLCVHHTEHDENCGYLEATEGTPCTHQHDESCGYLEGVEEVPCNMDCTDTDGDGIIDHDPQCAYTPAVEGAVCTHEHDESCGYTEAVEGTPCTYGVNGCSYCVVSWTWVDQEGLLAEDNGSWGLGLPGVNEDNLLTRDALAGLLPAQVNATIQNGESVALGLVWDLTAIPEEGTSGGDYTVTAALAQTEENYALTQNAAPLEVTVQLGGGEVYAPLPEGEPPVGQDASIVSGVSPNGTTINLFDYWITSREDKDIIPTGSDYADPCDIHQGINAGHALLFSYSNTSRRDDWNQWTHSKSVRPGIVQDKLGADGYPALDGKVSQEVSGAPQNESLAYLFDPDTPSGGKASYPDVQGLLQVDSDGYYYYDSAKNYAVYYEDTNSFTLYNYPGVVSAGNSGITGQFFPFNAVSGTAVSHNGSFVMSDLESNSSELNHYFGLHMSTRFVQQNDGRVSDEPDADAVTYEFSGDDDIWIFIDGTLVADLGGIHDKASVKIDFSSGLITINGKNEGYLGQILSSGNSNTLVDGTYHTLDFFYLERGNGDSNMYLKYNLVTIPESDLIKIDQLGDPVPGAEFALYAANDTERTNPIATGTTDNNGEFVFLTEDQNNQQRPITIQELYDDYGNEAVDGNDLILVETDTPEGYRTCGEIGLYFYKAPNDDVLLLSNSVWDKGAYAMPKVTSTTMKDTIFLYSNPNDITDTEVDTTGTPLNTQTNPLMFAVVFQKQGDGSWRPISGDPINGWTVQADSSWNSIVAAAKQSPYLFQLASSGAYQVEIDNLPGDIKDYYYFCQDQDEAKYTIAYYYSTAATLDNANGTNTKRIFADHNTYGLDRVFSMDLYVTNIQNRLLVQKVDEEDNTVNGAEFTLYEATPQNVTVAADGTVTINANATAYDQLTTENVTGILNLNGGGIFPTNGKVLENGEYYLVETDAPTGYKCDSTPIHVIVDNTGVYADAGVADDGITVLRGVGSVLKSVVQFAADDHVDTTLNGIKAYLHTSVQFDGYDENGSFNVSGIPSSDVLHLQYANTNKLLDYGLYDGTAGTIDNLTLATDVGWSKLLIRQCYRHEATVDTSLKTNLGNRDITNLFSGTVTVRVSNDQTGNLKISKTVDGTGAPADSFTFTVEVKDEKAGISGEYKTVDDAGAYDSVTFTDGAATVTLKDGENLTILGLPTGAEYTVTETQIPDNYEVSVNGNKVAAATGAIPHNTSETDAAEVSYTNTYYAQDMEVKAGKVWKDENNKDGIRPAQVTVKLLENGVDTGKTLTLNAGNSWEDSFTNLPEYKNGVQVTYTVEEVPVNGYTTAITGNVIDGFVITNSHTPAPAGSSDSSDDSSSSVAAPVVVQTAALPQTGDNAALGLRGVVIAAATVTLALLTVVSRKKKENR